MALDFPSSPVNGQVYDNFIYDAAKGTWKSLSSGASPNYLVNPTITDAVITATATTPSTIPLTVNGAASQSVNLQEWKNSAGIQLASVDASGNLTAQTLNAIGLNVNRENTVAEGGQINLRRSIDNANYWKIDVYGDTNTPALRIFNDVSGYVPGIIVDGSGRVFRPNQPRFQAFGASGSSGNSGVDWIFPNTYSNVGSHYNTSNGRFTAPVSGTYMFFWSNIGNTQNTVYRYRLRKNGTNIDDVHLRLETGTTSYKDNGVMQMIIDLATGDYVNIFFQSDNSTASYTTGQYPWFGGYLFG